MRLMPELGCWSVAFADVVRPRLDRDDLDAPEERELEREAMGVGSDARVRWIEDEKALILADWRVSQAGI